MSYQIVRVARPHFNEAGKLQQHLLNGVMSPCLLRGRIGNILDQVKYFAWPDPVFPVLIVQLLLIFS